MIASIPWLALASFVAHADESEEWRRLELQLRVVALEALSLPEPVWRLTGDAIELAGKRFAVRGGAGADAWVELDIDGDGDFDVALRGGGSGSVASFRVGGGAVYPVRLRVAESDGEWEWAPIGALRGRLLGTTITVFDLSGNGRYDDFGVDAVLLGSGLEASYLSRITAVDGELVELRFADDGRNAEARVWRGATGHVDARAGFRSGGELQSAIVRSGELAFELGRARDGLRIPVGEYELVRGRAAVGSRSVRIERGAMGPWVVVAERALVPEWGGPVLAECEAFFEDDVMHVLLFTLAADGRAGERYSGFEPRSARPTVRVRDIETGRHFGPAEHLPDARGDWGALLVPVGDAARLEVDLRVELPLFGSTPIDVLESSRWRRRDLGL